MKHACSAAAVLGALLVTQAHAQQCKGVSFAPQVQVEGATLHLNGLGLREATFLKVSVYVAALYVLTPSHDARELLNESPPKQLLLQFVRGVGVKDLREAFDKGFENTAGTLLPALRPRIATLEGMLRDVHSGERMGFTWLADHSVQFDLDGKVQGRIAGEDFAHALLGIWLGDHPPNAELKSGLLGGTCP